MRAGSDIKSIADVDRAGVRVIGVANTTTIRGAADAFALTRDTLASLAPSVPGSRILDGAFRRLEVAIAVPKWLDDAKASGLVRRAFHKGGFGVLPVAP